MVHEHGDGIWLTEEREISLTEIVSLSGLSEPELRELVDYGAIEPVDPGCASWRFTGLALPILRMARRLRIGFDLEPHAVAVVISLLERIRALESELAGARARLPRGDGTGSIVDL